MVSNHLFYFLCTLSAAVMLFSMVVYVTWEYNTTVDEQHDLRYCNYIGCDDCNKPHCLTDTKIFTDYAKFHQQTLMHSRKGNFLIFVCDHGLCGGYGNRIQGIAMALMFAILSNRTFLIQMKHPFDINKLLHPNTIKWNYTDYTNIEYSAKDFYLIDVPYLHKNWPSFSKEVFNSSINIITFHTNLGLNYYFNIFDDKWSKMFLDWFNITDDNSITTYACVTRYLFAYDKTVINAINKETQRLSLIPGLYVSVHFRSYQEAKDHSHPSAHPYLNCAVMIANEMTNTFHVNYTVYLMTDSERAEELANTDYFNHKITASHVKKVHVDQTANLASDVVLEGFIGLLVNIEVAAKGAVFVRAKDSTVSDLIESIVQLNNGLVIKPYRH